MGVKDIAITMQCACVYIIWSKYCISCIMKCSGINRVSGHVSTRWTQGWGGRSGYSLRMRGVNRTATNNTKKLTRHNSKFYEPFQVWFMSFSGTKHIDYSTIFHPQKRPYQLTLFFFLSFPVVVDKTRLLRFDWPVVHLQSNLWGKFYALANHRPAGGAFVI